MRAAEGTRFAGGSLTYVELTPEARGYLPINARHLLAGRARAGPFFGDIPVVQHYYALAHRTRARLLGRHLADARRRDRRPVHPDRQRRARYRLPSCASRWAPSTPSGLGVLFVDGGDVTEARGDGPRPPPLGGRHRRARDDALRSVHCTVRPREALLTRTMEPSQARSTRSISRSAKAY